MTQRINCSPWYPASTQIDTRRVTISQKLMEFRQQATCTVVLCITRSTHNHYQQQSSAYRQRSDVCARWFVLRHHNPPQDEPCFHSQLIDYRWWFGLVMLLDYLPPAATILVGGEYVPMCRQVAINGNNDIQFSILGNRAVTFARHIRHTERRESH